MLKELTKKETRIALGLKQFRQHNTLKYEILVNLKTIKNENIREKENTYNSGDKREIRKTNICKESKKIYPTTQSYKDSSKARKPSKVIK